MPDTHINRHGLGGNNPPPDLATLLDPTVLGDQLAIDHKIIFDRRDTLLAGVARFHERFKGGITNDEDAGRASSFVSQLKQAAKDAAATHTIAKAPFLAASRVVDAMLLQGAVTRLKDEARGIEDVMTAWSTEKMQRARQAAEAARIAAEEEAARVAAAAERTMHPEIIDQAIHAEQVAEKARADANASVASMSRIRGDLGGTASLRSRWTFRVIDINKVDRSLLKVDEDKIKALIKAGTRDGVDGIEIYDDMRTVVR